MVSNHPQSHRAIQHLVDGGVVFGAVGLPAADDPDIGRGRLDAFNTIRQPALPSLRYHREVPGARAAGAFAGHGQGVGPPVHHRQQVLAPLRIRPGSDDRLLGQVELCERVERVEVWARHLAEGPERTGPQGLNPPLHKIATVPRHREIKEGPVRAICKQLEIQQP